jgi:hypothetical protein
MTARPTLSKKESTPAMAALQSAFKELGMQVQFVEYATFRDDVPEVVVGSKPDPKLEAP